MFKTLFLKHYKTQIMFEGFEEQDENNSGQGLLTQNATNLANKAGSSKSISKLYINGV